MPQGRQTVTDNEIVDWMASTDEPAFVAAEVGEAFDLNSETARQRLTSIWQEGRIHRKKPAERTVLWWAECDHDSSAARA